MARQRFNVKFLGIGSGVLATTLAGAFVVKHYNVFKPPIKPETEMTLATDAYKQRDFETAAAHCQRVIEVQPKNSSAHLLLAQSILNHSGPDAVTGSLGEFGLAAAYDKDSKAAWKGLLEGYLLYLGRMEGGALRTDDQKFMVGKITQARDAARHLSQLDPEDPQGLSAIPIIDLRMWLLGFPVPLTDEQKALPLDKQPSEDDRVLADMAQLNDLLKKKLPDEQIPYWLARAKIHLADRDRANQDMTSANALFGEAASVFDEAITANPKTVGLYTAKVAILEQLSRTDQSAEAVADYSKEIKKTIEQLQPVADFDKSREDYLKIRYLYARLLSSTDPGRATDVFKDLIKKYPERPQISEDFAEMLRRDPSRIKDALAVLDAVPATAPASVQSERDILRWDAQYAEVRLKRAGIQTDQLEGIAPGEIKKATSDEIAAELAIAQTRFAGTPDYLLTRGKFQMAMGQYRDAIGTLTDAQDKVRANNQNDPRVLIALANAYQGGGQALNAVQLFETALQNPAIANNVQVRIKLAFALITMNDFERAKGQVDWLKKRLSPTEPVLVRLQVMCMGLKPDQSAVAKLLADMPETKPEEIRPKTEIAIQYGDWPDAIRLLKVLQAANPDDVLLPLRLIQVQMNGDQVDDARATLADAVKRWPDNPAFKIADAQLNHNGSAGDVYKIKRDFITQKVTDPFASNMALADVDHAFARFEEEIDELKKAAAIQPDNIDTAQDLFFRYLDARRFDDATAMIPHLQAINADQAHGQVLQVKLALATRDATTAVTIARQIVTQSPDFWLGHQLLGDAYKMASQFDLAIGEYTVAWQKQPNNADVLQSLIQCNAILRRTDDARRYIGEARKMFPEDPKYRAIEVTFECTYGNAEPLLPSLAQAVQTHPDNPQNFSLYEQALLATHRLHRDKGETTLAEPFLTTLLATAKDATQRWPDDLTFAGSYAEALLRNNDPKGAEAVVLAVTQRPRWKDQPMGQFMIGQYYLNLSDYAKAEPYLRRVAIELVPNSIEARVKLADDLWNQDKKEDALRILKPVAPTRLDAFQLYDRMLIDLKRGDQAEAETNVALAANPKNPELNNLLIQVYRLNGKTDQAMELARKVIADDPKNIGAYHELGQLQAAGRTPDIDEAIHNISLYAEAYPDDVPARMEIGDLYSRKADREHATAQFEIASKLAPTNKQVRIRLLDSYLNAKRTKDAEELVTDMLRMQVFEHDADFLRAAAVLWAGNGENAKAKKAIYEAISLVKDGPEKAPATYDFLNVLLLTKSYDELIAEADKLIGGPDVPWSTYVFRGRAKDSNGDADGAVADFKVALDKSGTDSNPFAPVFAGIAIREQIGIDKTADLIKPRAANSTIWKMVLVNLYKNARDNNHAFEYADAALKDSANINAVTRRDLIRTAASLAAITSPPQYDRAAELFREVLKDSPDDWVSMNDLATVLDDSPDKASPKEALLWSAKAYDIVSKKGVLPAAIDDTYGWSLILNDQIDDGMTKLHDACDRVEIPDGHYHLARGYLKKKLPEDALRELKVATDQLANATAAHQDVDSTLADKINLATVEATKMKSELDAAAQKQ